MRKYYQAILALTAVISLVSLLIYRHEYHRLRYVLEVFHYFGKPGQKAGMNCTDAALASFFGNDTDAGFGQQPLSSWQRIDNDLYVYSVYHMNDQKIRAIAFGRQDSIVKRRCAIYFEHETTPSLHTSLNYDIINGTSASSHAGYRIVCYFNSDKVPVRVSFVESLDDHTLNSDDSPLFPIKTQPREPFQNTDLIFCVAPPASKLLPATDMLGFLKFHQSIGVNRFVAYDFGIPSELDSQIKERLGSSYTPVPWNFPFVGIDYDDAARSIAHAECFYRAHNKAKFIVTIAWDEYVILMYHRSIIRLLTDLDQMNTNALRYALKSFTFCTQQLDDKKFDNMKMVAFRKTSYDKTIGDDRRPAYVYRGQNLLLGEASDYTRMIKKVLVRLHRYRFCKDYRADGPNYKYDATISRFIKNVEDMSD